MSITITEALAEIKTIDKRIEAKRQLIGTALFRQQLMRDPYESEGGSRALIARERQSIGDLETRIVNLRRAIQRANEATPVTIGEVTRNIADWLVWRREIAPGLQQQLGNLRNQLASMRQQAQQKGLTIVAGENGQLNDIVVNLDEGALAKEIETVGDILGALDGQLSLKNATVTIAEV